MQSRAAIISAKFVAFCHHFGPALLFILIFIFSRIRPRLFRIKIVQIHN